MDRRRGHLPRRPFSKLTTRSATAAAAARIVVATAAAPLVSVGVMLRALMVFLMAGLAPALADPAADVRAALEALRRSSFSWETTARQRFTEPTEGTNRGTAPATDPALEVKGRSGTDGTTEITLLASKSTVATPVTVFLKEGGAVASTPLGWLTRGEIREILGTRRDETLPFEGNPVPLHRALTVAQRAMTTESALEQLLNLMVDVKAYREDDGDPVGELSERAVETLWGDARAKSAPDIAGRVTFRIRDGVLTEYRVRLEISFPPPRSRPATRTVTQWTTRITALGTTTVMPPAEVARKLEN
jgi:hypothetical protein